MSIQVRSPRRHERARQVSAGSLFPLLLIAGVGLTAIATPGGALGDGFGAALPKLNTAQKKFFRNCEKKLATRFNSKENPGDKGTWYVIYFTETAAGARQSRSVSGNILTITRELQAARNNAAKMTQGRKQAALLLVQYYSAANSAAAKLQPTAGGRTDWATAAADKSWRYKAFAKEDEAKAFFDQINPKKKP